MDPISDWIFADFNKTGNGLLVLATIGTKKSLEYFKKELHEGDVVTFWDEDMSVEGYFDPLVVTAKVYWDSDWKEWAARYDMDSLVHASEKIPDWIENRKQNFMILARPLSDTHTEAYYERVYR